MADNSKSIWHYPSEEPDCDELLIIEDIEGRLYIDYSYIICSAMVRRWAYYKDIESL